MTAREARGRGPVPGRVGAAPRGPRVRAASQQPLGEDVAGRAERKGFVPDHVGETKAPVEMREKRAAPRGFPPERGAERRRGDGDEDEVALLDRKSTRLN